MAIGSSPEIGTDFGKRWGELTEEQRLAWWEYMRTYWGDNLLAGYAVVAYPPGRNEAGPLEVPFEVFVA